MTLDDSDLFDAPSGPRPGAAPPRKCRRHHVDRFDLPTTDSGTYCALLR